MIFPPSQLTVVSPENGTAYRISLTPPDSATQPGPWRVLVYLDADDHAPAVLDAYRGLWARGEGRPMLLVGVGYGAGFRKPGNKRIRDFTPRPVEGEPEAGGAEAFHQFLVETLWAKLRQNFPISDDEPLIAGHSLGGLFVLHALFHVRPWFRRGLACAPSAWWDDQAVVRYVAARHAVDPNLAARLYVAVGESDTESMHESLGQLERQLREHAFHGLRVEWQRFPGRGHFNVIEAAYAAGLRVLVR